VSNSLRAVFGCRARQHRTRVLDVFSVARYPPAMPEVPHLRPATPDEIAPLPVTIPDW
jgi:hypothetical protein